MTMCDIMNMHDGGGGGSGAGGERQVPGGDDRRRGGDGASSGTCASPLPPRRQRLLDRRRACRPTARLADARSPVVVQLAPDNRHRQDTRSRHQQPPAALPRAENTRHRSANLSFSS